MSRILRPAGYTCPSDHLHDANLTCRYTHGCRCAACRKLGAAYSRERRQADAPQRDDRVSAEAALEHLHMLRDYGISFRRIGELIGRSTNYIRGLLEAGPDDFTDLTIPVELEARIFWVQPELRFAGPADRVDATGVRRRVQALVANGWGISAVAERVGISRANLQLICTTERRVNPILQHRIIRTYEKLWNVAPPSSTPSEKMAKTRALCSAKRRGWVPPLAWDDIDHDLAPVMPAEDREFVDEVAVARLLRGEKVEATRAEVLTAIETLHLRELSDSEIGKLICWEKDRVQKARTRAA